MVFNLILPDILIKRLSYSTDLLTDLFPKVINSLLDFLGNTSNKESVVRLCEVVLTCELVNLYSDDLVVFEFFPVDAMTG